VRVVFFFIARQQIHKMFPAKILMKSQFAQPSNNSVSGVSEGNWRQGWW
jgi:hypothetical protein